MKTQWQHSTWREPKRFVSPPSVAASDATVVFNARHQANDTVAGQSSRENRTHRPKGHRQLKDSVDGCLHPDKGPSAMPSFANRQPFHTIDGFAPTCPGSPGSLAFCPPDRHRRAARYAAAANEASTRQLQSARSGGSSPGSAGASQAGSFTLGPAPSGSATMKPSSSQGSGAAGRPRAATSNCGSRSSRGGSQREPLEMTGCRGVSTTVVCDRTGQPMVAAGGRA